MIQVAKRVYSPDVQVTGGLNRTRAQTQRVTVTRLPLVVGGATKAVATAPTEQVRFLAKERDGVATRFEWRVRLYHSGRDRENPTFAWELVDAAFDWRFVTPLAPLLAEREEAFEVADMAHGLNTWVVQVSAWTDETLVGGAQLSLTLRRRFSAVPAGLLPAAGAGLGATPAVVPPAGLAAPLDGAHVVEDSALIGPAVAIATFSRGSR